MNIGRRKTNLPKKNNKLRLPLSVYLVYLLVATVVMTGVTFSGYITTVTGSDEVRVAVMATDATIMVTDQVPVCPGDSVKIPVVISNRDKDGRICEVAQAYQLSVTQLEDNLPLVFAVYEDEDCTVQVTSPGGEFAASTERTDKYWIKVTWPEEKNSASYTLLVDALVITISAEQID